MMRFAMIKNGRSTLVCFELKISTLSALRLEIPAAPELNRLLFSRDTCGVDKEET